MTYLFNIEVPLANFIIAQIFCCLAVTSNVISYNTKKKHRALLWLMLVNVLYGFHYLLLNAASGAILSFLAAFRCYVYYEYTIKRIKTPFLVLITFCSLTILLGIISYSNLFSIFAIVATLLNTIGSWHPNLKVYRICGILIALCLIIYNVHVGAILAIITTIIELISAIVGLIRLDILKKRRKQNQNKQINK